MPKTGQMKQTKFLKGECQHCGGHIEFPAESTGLTTDCPHCGKQTELLLALPKEEPTIPTATIVYTVIAIIILGAGLVGAMVALKMAQRKVVHKKAEVATEAPLVASSNATVDAGDAVVQAGFHSSPITIEKTKGSSLIYAIGTLSNISDRQRFGVKVQFDLFDESGQKVGTAKDYQQVIEPKSEWKFRALVVTAKATSAKVASVTEEK
jgi:uncharacterized OB-fold protein